MRELLKIFTSFFKIGLFTFGGGLAMIPLIQRTVVDDYHWLTDEEMIDCIAVAQAMPGVVAINTATYIGNRKRGFAGALFATLGVILPSFIVIIIVVMFLNAIGDNKYVNGAFTGIKAASCGLILYSSYKIAKQTVNALFPAVLAAVSFVLVAFFDMSAVVMIVCGAIVGCVYIAVRGSENGASDEGSGNSGNSGNSGRNNGNGGDK